MHSAGLEGYLPVAMAAAVVVAAVSCRLWSRAIGGAGVERECDGSRRERRQRFCCDRKYCRSGGGGMVAVAGAEILLLRPAELLAMAGPDS